jgi:hypothetical protein
MSILSSRERKYAEAIRREKAANTSYTSREILPFVASYKKKATARMKVFYAESQRMDKKLPELLKKAESLGVFVEELTFNEVDKENLHNYRKKTKSISFNVLARRDSYKLEGILNITPASMQLVLNCSELKQIRTKNGFGLPLIKITYYRTLNVRDNYLSSLIGGGTYKTEVLEEQEILF